MKFILNFKKFAPQYSLQSILYLSSLQCFYVLALALLLSGCSENKTKDNINHKTVPHQHIEKKERVACKNWDEKAKYFSKSIEVTGEVENKLVLTVDDLKKMNQNNLNNVDIICENGAKTSVRKSYKGVLLKDILSKAKIIQHHHRDRNFYIVARASDDYMATFSWAELFNNVNGEKTYVMYEENEKPIQDEGAMILISKNDLKTGPRHVSWLKSIEVYRVK
ncbi:MULTISPECIES: molybdopterin-dependent oxidoreductase [Sphingobacterium]|uniref:molybdopterin-dependent oxidoreductase n=1 Tax=Sphingobacterium TaxID=28453 RepID=UPI0013DD80E6|nr:MULTISPECIES: molybdopterin-dependent oxidoreductase [unclassified Sphingobacterium]